MNLLCVGISHHTAPLEIRERFWFSPEEVQKALSTLRTNAVGECVLFSTCNRTEVYCFSGQGVLDPQALMKFLGSEKSVTGDYSPNFFVHQGMEAVQHLFNVTSGIDSMIVGDVQILAQVKEGLNFAREAGTAGFLMKKLFQSSFHAGKRARSQTRIGEGAVSVSYAAVELAGRIFERFAEKSALVIGAGDMAQLTAKHLHGRNIGRLYITNRTQDRSEQLARMVGGSVIPFEEFPQKLNEVDIIISSVTGNSYILTAEDIRAVNRERASVLFIIDIGVPRNIDPDARKLENVFLYDLDNLRGLVSENEHKRLAEVPGVEEIIATELVEFQNWFSSLHTTPTIAALTELVERIRKEEVEKNINRFDPKDRELLQTLTKRIANKILHAPITNLKNGHNETHGERLQKLNALRKLFGIDKAKDADDR